MSFFFFLNEILRKQFKPSQWCVLLIFKKTLAAVNQIARNKMTKFNQPLISFTHFLQSQVFSGRTRVYMQLHSQYKLDIFLKLFNFMLENRQRVSSSTVCNSISSSVHVATHMHGEGKGSRNQSSLQNLSCKNWWRVFIKQLQVR